MRHATALTALIALTALTALVVLPACSGGSRGRETEGTAEGAGGGGGRVSIKGSDTMVVLAQRFAERYMQTHPGVTIEVSGGGSGTGVAALLNRTTDIANSSRPLSDRERASVLALGSAAVETPVALDALAVYVHEGNPIRSLTMQQLGAIYRGQITNWSNLGGADAPIVLYSRENNSGTYAYFKEHVLDGDDFAASTQTLPGTAAVINAVARDPNGIGYGGIAYATGIRALPISTDGGEPVEPSVENATSGRYPLSRFLFMVTRGAPDGTAGELIEWARSADGQAVVTDIGYYPLPAGTGVGSAAPGAAAPGAAAPGVVPAGEAAPAP